MSVKLELESLLATRQDYDRAIGHLLNSLERAKDQAQLIKNIVLFCKNCLSITSKPVTKYLVVRLINDITNVVGFDQLATLLETNILRKVLDACLGHGRGRMAELSDEDKRFYEDFIKVAVETIYHWASQTDNPKSKFAQAADELREKEIGSSGQLKGHSNSRTVLYVSSPSKQRSRAKSVTHEDREAILRLIDIFQGIEMSVEDEFKKSERNHGYKIKIREIVDRLNTFLDEFAESYRFLKKGTDLDKVSVYVNVSKEFLSRIDMNRPLPDKQIRRLIEDTFFESSDPNLTQPKKKGESSEPASLKKLDIFQILQNIHRRIENEEKSLGVYGNYEMKNIFLDDDEKYESTLNLEKHRHSIDLKNSR